MSVEILHDHQTAMWEEGWGAITVNEGNDIAYFLVIGIISTKKYSFQIESGQLG